MTTQLPSFNQLTKNSKKLIVIASFRQKVIATRMKTKRIHASQGKKSFA